MRGSGNADMSTEYQRNGYKCKLFLLGFAELLAGFAITIPSVLVLKGGALSYIGAHTIVNSVLLLSVAMNAYVLEHCFICIHITSMASGLVVTIASAAFMIFNAITTRPTGTFNEIYVNSFVLLSIAFISSFAQVIMCVKIAIMILRNRPGTNVPDVEIARTGTAYVGSTNETNMPVTVSQTVSKTHVSRFTDEPPTYASLFDGNGEYPVISLLDTNLIEKGLANS